MNKDEFITERTRIISEMLDNPDECDIYPTTKCFEELDALFEKIISENKQLKDEIYNLVQRYESADRKVDFAIWFRTQVKRLRQLS